MQVFIIEVEVSSLEWFVLVCLGVRNVFETGHLLGLKQMILSPTWWLFISLHLYINPVGLEQESKPEQNSNVKRRSELEKA